MRILYVVFKYLTFAGSFLRGFWEHITCQLLGLFVEDSAYLRANEMCGHVEFIFPEKNSAAYLITLGPGAINFITGLPMLLVGIVNLRLMGISWPDSPLLFVVYILMTYVGASLMCSLFPSYEAALYLWERIRTESSLAEKIFLSPACLTAYIGSWLERFGIPQIFWAAAITVIFII